VSGDGRLTTHVLDAARGRPAAGVEIELRRQGEHTPIRTVRTNADGRTDEPLLAGADLVAGRYELRFAIGAYFAAGGLPVDDPPFFDIVPVRVTIADAGAHYHVPLLASPGAYSTYRGS
jgi:5-hydroxyisourate hydrolase